MHYNYIYCLARLACGSCGPAVEERVSRNLVFFLTLVGKLGSMERSLWAVPVSDMRGALRALYEVTIMPVFIAVYTHKCISVILNN